MVCERNAWRLAQYASGGLGLAMLTLVCFRPGLDLSTTAFVYLILITVLSLRGSFLDSVIFFLVAVACLAYFFAPRIFTFRFDSPQQIMLGITFVLTSLTVTRLVGQARKQAHAALQAQEALRRSVACLAKSEEQWRDVFENNPTMYFIVDAGGRIAAVNPLGAEQLGCTAEELVGQSELSVIHESDREAVHRHIAGCLEDLGRARSWEARKVRKDGKLLWVRETAKAVSRVGGPIVLIACEDISDRKQLDAEKERLEAQLRQSQRMEAMAGFAGDIVHDFNNILGAILGFGELAEEAAPEGSDAHRYISTMMRAGARGKALVEHILAFSRTGLGDRSPVNVQAVVEEVLDLLVVSLGPGICLNRRLEAGSAIVAGDATQLHRVVMNLCTNARQAMQKGGVLEVLLDRTDVEQPCRLSHADLGSGRYVRLRVRDTGNGIPAHVFDRMFDPFFTTKSVTGGTGLGLSVVHGIVTDLGGSIDVRTAVGRGTTFTIWLPVDAV